MQWNEVFEVTGRAWRGIGVIPKSGWTLQPAYRDFEAAYRFSLSGRLAYSTDSFVVRPLFFPGGSIGELAVKGTVNDLAMSGAQPLYLSAGFILEEGFPLDSLGKIVDGWQRRHVEPTCRL